MLATVACDEKGGAAYALEASIFVAGAAIQWLRDGLGILFNASESERLARSLDSNDGVYFVPALVGLGAPNWEPRARGTIVGLTRGTNRAHLARAALEAMAYGSAEMLSVMAKRGKVKFEALRVDGGASANNWLLQFQSDILGIPVERPDMIETTALGAAVSSGIAGGVWRDSAESSARGSSRAHAGMPRESADELMAGCSARLDGALVWARRQRRAAEPGSPKKSATKNPRRHQPARTAPNPPRIRDIAPTPKVNQILALCLATNLGFAQTVVVRDSWFGVDKIKHFHFGVQESMTYSALQALTSNGDRH